MRPLFLIGLLALPLFAQAATFKDFTEDVVTFVNTSVVPLVYAIAFLIFLIGMTRFFFLGGDEGREKGKTFMFWGIIAFVVMLSVWGIVNLLLATIGVSSQTP